MLEMLFCYPQVIHKPCPQLIHRQKGQLELDFEQVAHGFEHQNKTCQKH